MDITRWSTPKSDILCSRRCRSSIQSAKTRLGADCDIDHEILIAKCRHKLKKVGTINRSCRYAAKSLQSSPTLRPHRRQPTKLPHPWDSLGKNTGVGCHFLLQCVKVKSESEVAQSSSTLRDPMDCSLPGSSIHGILQARVLEWGAIAFSRFLGDSYIKTTA